MFFAKMKAKTRSIISKLQAGEANPIPNLGMWFGVAPLIIKKTIFCGYMNSKKHIKKHKKEVQNHDYLKESCRN